MSHPEPCTSAPARPFLYEGVFAHEYQHLLMEYEDTDEVNWINEVFDWAQTLTGYVDPSKPIDDIDFDSHIQCMLGWPASRPITPSLARRAGLENSLTVWSDQGDDEIPCDYGPPIRSWSCSPTGSGTDFMSALHRNDANGLAGLQDVLDDFGGGDAADLIHEWAAMLALRPGRRTSTAMSLITRWRLYASINDTVHAYDTPGALSNGSITSGCVMWAGPFERRADRGDQLQWRVRAGIVDRRSRRAWSGRCRAYSQTGALVDAQIEKSLYRPRSDADLRCPLGHRGVVGLRLCSGLDPAKVPTWTSSPTAKADVGPRSGCG